VLAQFVEGVHEVTVYEMKIILLAQWKYNRFAVAEGRKSL
jgi:hypothetical protein